MNKSLILVLGILFIFPMISASLVITSPSNITVLKDYQVPKILEINIKNTENFQFYNLEFEQSWIEMDKINLSSGQNKTIPIRITGNNDFSGNITLRGYYERTIGASNKTEEVKINYNYGLDRCDIELVKGDKIKWINEVADEVTLYNILTSQDFKIILEDQNYTKTFDTAGTLTYLVKRIGIPFTETCTIETSEDTGLVHGSQYDASIFLELKINYDPTELNVEYIETNYTLTYNEQKDDVLKIKNNGSNIGKNVKLESSWITFNENNFDLSSGASKTIQYTITPQVFKTNETNKTHIINVTITGNFPTITRQIGVFVPYANLDTIFSGDADKSVIENFIKFYCKENPESEVCKKESDNLNGSTSTIEISTETFKAWVERTANNEDQNEIYKQNDLEYKNNQSQIDQNQSNEIAGLKEEQNKTNYLIEKLTSSLIFVIILLLVVAGIYGLIKWYFSDGFKSSVRKQTKMYKGEQFY